MLEELIYALKKAIPILIFKLIPKYFKIREPLFWVIVITVIIIGIIGAVLEGRKDRKKNQTEYLKEMKNVPKELTRKEIKKYSEERILCSDGNCIGVINETGVCNICGKPYTKEL